MIDIKNLHKNFSNRVYPLQGADLTLQEGTTTVLIGKSGTGKSVLLKSIVGLIEPDEGSIKVDGVEVVGASSKTLGELRRQVGYVFQGGALYDSLTVGQNLAFPLEKTSSLSKGEIRDRVEHYLAEVGLSEKIDQMPADLSGGQRKRIGVARTMVTEPKYLLYDEPTTGLDPLTTRDISELILELQNNLGIGAIAVTHDPYCLSLIANRVAYINDGTIEFEGTLIEAVEQDDPFLESFFVSLKGSIQSPSS